jgi:ornithine cyclodeaminase/alanine dehydrogenase
VENAFGTLGRKEVPPPAIMGVPSGDGGFHIKAAILGDAKEHYFAAKCNANFPNNKGRFGLPAIQGLLILCDAESGFPVAVMDSIEITILRTGAATAVAAKYLARPDSKVATICGCGNQGRVQLKALAAVLPIERVHAFDLNPQASAGLVKLATQLGMSAQAVENLPAALKQSDVCVTCTPSRRAFVFLEDVAPGTFIAAVGADSPDKQELDPRLVKAGTVVVDSLDQCAAIGEVHHAIEAGLVRKSQEHPELGEIVAGLRPGRQKREEITIFDSTGVAIQDAAAAIAVFRLAAKSGGASPMIFNDLTSFEEI